MEVDYLSQGRFVPEWHLLPHIFQSDCIQLWDQPEVDLMTSSRMNQCQQYYTWENPLPLGALGLKMFNHPQAGQGTCGFPPSALVPLVMSKCLAEHVTGQ